MSAAPGGGLGDPLADLPPAHRAAVIELRMHQLHAREAAGLVAPLFTTDQLGRALAAADEREAATHVAPPWAYTRSAKRLLVPEQALWRRTREILQRSRPGPDEDGRYLEMLARQAASVEMALCNELVDRDDDGPPLGPAEPALRALCQRTLLGTLPTQEPGAYSRQHEGHYFAQVSAGLMDFVYQLTKITVQAWPRKPAPKGSLVSFSSIPEEIDAHIDAHPELTRALHDVLRRYLFEGVPRQRDSSAPPDPYTVPLEMLTQWNERFVVAHEYAHVLHAAHDVVYPEGGAPAEELAADMLAFRWLALSGVHLDRVAPNMATQGAHFVITALEVLRQARDIVRHGAVQAARPDAAHPAPTQRLAVLNDCHRRWISAEDDDLSIRGAMVPVRTLHSLWAHLLREGAPAEWAGRPLHVMWRDHR